MLFVPFVLFVALVTVAAVACGNHAEAVLILGGLKEIADEGTRGVRVAQWFVLEHVNPRVVTRFIRTATQIGEVLEEHERLIVIRINHALIRCETHQHHRASIRLVVKQAN